jgi:DNA-binding response OmpR family regulator
MPHTILVVEDTELLRRMYTDRLTQDGYRVLSASDGLEALSVMRNETPDLVLLDLIMPKMSGIEVLERIQSDTRLHEIPVLILSNLGQDEDIRRCVELGASDYLIKNDARPADIAAKIKSLLRDAAEKSESAVYHLQIRDKELDADRFIADAQLTRRLWCPACEVELSLELAPVEGVPGHYDAHIVCLMCGREY